jgi:hypothetical protein
MCINNIDVAVETENTHFLHVFFLYPVFFRMFVSYSCSFIYFLAFRVSNLQDFVIVWSKGDRILSADR